ncbi:MAG TPA: hypothetical protein VF469_21385 [Kofleriaceae bacterium]
MRDWLLTLALFACGKDGAGPTRAPIEGTPVESENSREATTGTADAAALPPHRAYPDLATALSATIPADARVVGFGELHARTDRAATTSTLASFTRALPAFADRLSDLVLETWQVDPTCGAPAVAATARIETQVKRPEVTRSELAELADAARAAHIQLHAMTLTCADYAAIAPTDGEVGPTGEAPRPAGGAVGVPTPRDTASPIDPVAMLTLTTRELRRIAASAVVHRDREPGHRPWIAVYGGALHNDRFPDASVAEWSYAAEADRATGGHFVEIDLIVPELAAADAASRRAPWFRLAGAARDPATPILVWTRGERSFVVLLPPRPPT